MWFRLISWRTPEFACLDNKIWEEERYFIVWRPVRGLGQGFSLRAAIKVTSDEPLAVKDSQSLRHVFFFLLVVVRSPLYLHTLTFCFNITHRVEYPINLGDTFSNLINTWCLYCAGYNLPWLLITLTGYFLHIQQIKYLAAKINPRLSTLSKSKLICS